MWEYGGDPSNQTPPVKVMRLDQAHALRLFNAAGTETITLDPEGTPSMMIGGSGVITSGTLASNLAGMTIPGSLSLTAGLDINGSSVVTQDDSVVRLNGNTLDLGTRTVGGVGVRSVYFDTGGSSFLSSYQKRNGAMWEWQHTAYGGVVRTPMRMYSSDFWGASLYLFTPTSTLGASTSTSSPSGWEQAVRLSSRYSNYFKNGVGVGTSSVDSGKILHVVGDTLLDGSLTGNGSLLYEGYFDETATNIPKQGAGTRIMWYPESAAFRAGHVSATKWDDVNIGDYSVAMGLDSLASGMYAFAAGVGSSATGSASTALGAGYAGGEYATALGAGFANKAGSSAMGIGTYALGSSSTAMGESCFAIGDYSTAMGNWSTANADYSTAMGASYADGDFSTAMGFLTEIDSYAATAMGSYNVNKHTMPGQGAWVDLASNSVLEIGIGSGIGDKKNALTVMKDGSVEIGNDAGDGSIPLHVKSDGSVVLAKAQGDISMGIYEVQ